MSVTKDYFANLAAALALMPEGKIDAMYAWMKEAYDAEKQIFVMGNGGSAATASHFVVDMNKGVSMNLSKKFRMIALNDNQPSLTAYANDESYDVVFEKALENFIRPGDLVIGISTSGNSKNVVRAFELAKIRGNRPVAMTARPGGRLAEIADLTVAVPTEDIQIAEDLHLSMVHMFMKRFCAELGIAPAGKPNNPSR